MENKHEGEYFADITSYLTAMNIADTQKHEDFHIVKFQDQMGKTPTKVTERKIGFFQIITSYNHNVELDIDSTNFKGNNEVLVLVSPDQKVSFKVKGLQKGAIGYMIAFSADFLNIAPSTYSIYKTFPFFNPNRPPVYFVNKNKHKFFINYMEKINDHFQNFNKDNIEVIKSYMTIMLFEAKSMFSDGEVKSVANSRVDEITFLFESLIIQTKSKKQKLEYYADKLNFSPIYLSECVKKATGKTAKSIISDYLVLEAKSLLKQTTDTIDNISLQMGYNDTSNFISFFKKNTGNTPSNFRKI